MFIRADSHLSVRGVEDKGEKVHLKTHAPQGVGKGKGHG